MRIAVFEALQGLSTDNERLRLSIAAAREAAARADDEARHLKRENARLGAAVVSMWEPCCGVACYGDVNREGQHACDQPSGLKQ